MINAITSPMRILGKSASAFSQRQALGERSFLSLAVILSDKVSTEMVLDLVADQQDQ
jgi:hypothetical protein